MRKGGEMVKVVGVEAHSRAAKAKIKPGDILISVNGNEINDVLDYRFYLAEETVVLKINRDGETFDFTVKKQVYDDIGLEFETPLMDVKHSCRNKCIFCFIDQLPKGMRETLYFKDDDSRLSFLHGNYITLTNLTDHDIDRIVKMRFSPINISVHTTNPELRVKMMKNRRAGEVLSYLKRIYDAHLTMHGQIVLCRGINDGEELERTMHDLAGYYPYLDSVSVVPAGLTKYRDGLFPLTQYTQDEATQVIEQVNSFGDEMLKKHGSRVFFLADEFYLKAHMPMPDEEYYEGYPQIENGVGMLRSLCEEFDFAVSDIADLKLHGKRTVSVACGYAAYDHLYTIAEKLMRIYPNLKINVYRIVNEFFGEEITVSGLLTGKDICRQLEGRELGDALLISENCLRSGEDVFLCGMTLPEMEKKLKIKVIPSGSDGYSLVCDMLGKKPKRR